MGTTTDYTGSIRGIRKDVLSDAEIERRVFGDIIDGPEQKMKEQALLAEHTILMEGLAAGDAEITVIDKPRDGRSAPRIHRIDLLLLAFQYMSGLTTAQSAASFHVSEAGIAKARVSSQFKAVLAQLTAATTASVRTYLAGATTKASHVLVDLLDSDSEKIQLAAAVQILDRSGIKAADKVEITTQATGVHNMSESELIELVKSAMKELPGGSAQ